MGRWDFTEIEPGGSSETCPFPRRSPGYQLSTAHGPAWLWYGAPLWSGMGPFVGGPWGSGLGPGAGEFCKGVDGKECCSGQPEQDGPPHRPPAVDLALQDSLPLSGPLFPHLMKIPGVRAGQGKAEKSRQDFALCEVPPTQQGGCLPLHSERCWAAPLCRRAVGRRWAGVVSHVAPASLTPALCPVAPGGREGSGPATAACGEAGGSSGQQALGAQQCS